MHRDTHHLVHVGVAEGFALAELVAQGPEDDAAGGEDRVVEELVDDVDAGAGLLGPVGHDAGDDLAACGFGGGADGEEEGLGALDAGEDVGKGFGAEEEDGAKEGVGGLDEGVGDAEGGGFVFDGGHGLLDLGIGGFGFQEAEDLSALWSVWCFCRSQ